MAPRAPLWTEAERDILRKYRTKANPLTYAQISQQFLPNRSADTLASQWSRMNKASLNATATGAIAEAVGQNSGQGAAQSTVWTAPTGAPQDRPQAQTTKGANRVGKAKTVMTGRVSKPTNKTGVKPERQTQDDYEDSASEEASESDDRIQNDNNHGSDDDNDDDQAGAPEEASHSANDTSVTSAETPSDKSSSSGNETTESGSPNTSAVNKRLNQLARAAEAIDVENTVRRSQKVSKKAVDQSRVQSSHEYIAPFGSYESVKNGIQKILPTWTPGQPFTSTKFRAAVGLPSPPLNNPYCAATPERIERYKATNIGMRNTDSREDEEKLDLAADQLLKEWTSPTRQNWSVSSQEHITKLSNKALDLYENPSSQAPHNSDPTDNDDSDSIISDSDEMAKSANEMTRNAMRRAALTKAQWASERADNLERTIEDRNVQMQFLEEMVEAQRVRIDRLEIELEKRDAELRHYKALFAAIMELMTGGVAGELIDNPVKGPSDEEMVA